MLTQKGQLNFLSVMVILTVLAVGGNLNNPSLSGVVAWNSNNASSNANWNIGGRFSSFVVHKRLCVQNALTITLYLKGKNNSKTRSF